MEIVFHKILKKHGRAEEGEHVYIVSNYLFIHIDYN